MTTSNRYEGGDPGVPEALGRAAAALLEGVDRSVIETVWLFPPLRKGRREHGLLAAGCRIEGTDRHLLVTVAYRAEETGKGVTFDARLQEEGEAPPDRLPVIIEGVIRRFDAGSGEPERMGVEELLRELGLPEAD